MNRQKSETRYIVSDVVSIPVCRMAGKGEAYKYATKPGWGVVDWYSETNNYSAPVNRDKDDKTQELICDDDTSAVLYLKYGREFCISPGENVAIKEIPRQAEVDLIVVGDCCGYNFWASDLNNIKFFATYDENGLIDTYRIENWAGKPYDGETELAFEDLQSTDDYDKIDRADIVGTLEHDRKQAKNKAADATNADDPNA